MANQESSKGTKVVLRGYSGYQYTYMGTTYVIWNGSCTSQAKWYIDVIDTDLQFTERELDGIYHTKNHADRYMKSLIIDRNKG